MTYWYWILLVLDIIEGAPSNVLGYLEIFQRRFYMVLGSFSPKITFWQNVQELQISLLKLCKTVHVRNNSFTGLSPESIANILVPK